MEVVLVRPEIPQNTGSVARTCAATGVPLHVVRPIPFEISDRTVKRAGLDYWPYVDLTVHESWDDYLAARRGTSGRPLSAWFFSARASRPYTSAAFAPGDALVFGGESKGLDPALLAAYPDDRKLLVPIARPQVRSLNLSNVVAVAVYEAIRQFGVR